MSFRFAPQRKSPSNALWRSRSVMKALKRETTMPKRLPEALSLPSSALTWKPERTSTGEVSWLFFFVTLWLRVGNQNPV